MALASPARLSGTHWFLFVVTISFIGTLIWIFVYLLSIREALKLPIDWVLSASFYPPKCWLIIKLNLLVGVGKHRNLRSFVLHCLPGADNRLGRISVSRQGCQHNSRRKFVWKKNKQTTIWFLVLFCWECRYSVY